MSGGSHLKSVRALLFLYKWPGVVRPRISSCQLLSLIYIMARRRLRNLDIGEVAMYVRVAAGRNGGRHQMMLLSACSEK